MDKVYCVYHGRPWDLMLIKIFSNYDSAVKYVESQKDISEYDYNDGEWISNYSDDVYRIYEMDVYE